MTEPHRVLVEVFAAPNCNRCGQASLLVETIVKKLANENVQWREIDIVEDIDYAVQLGVLATPAIALNGALIFTSLPSKAKLHAAIQNYLKNYE